MSLAGPDARCGRAYSRVGRDWVSSLIILEKMEWAECRSIEFQWHLKATAASTKERSCSGM
jgi:hypothetical protein